MPRAHMTITNSHKDDSFHFFYGIRPCIGEVLSGDEVIFLRHEHGTFFGIIDGLGHGRKAATVAQEIKEYCLSNYQLPLTTLLTQAHEFFKGSQGAVIAICHIYNDGQAEYIGLGNVETRLLSPNPQRQIVLLPRDGALGIRSRTIQSTQWQMLEGESIVMYSDGISSQVLKANPNNLHIYHVADIRNVIDQYGKSHDDAAFLYLHKPMPSTSHHA
jgi:phosphoserine phosphatase RsbX